MSWRRRSSWPTDCGRRADTSCGAGLQSCRPNPKVPSRRDEIVLLGADFVGNGEAVHVTTPNIPARPDSSSGLDFQDHLQFDRRTERKACNTKDEARRDGLLAEDIAKQLRCRIGDLWVLRELRRRGDIHPEPDDTAHAVQR